MTNSTAFSAICRPSRYLGGELGSIRKNTAEVDLTFALAFPDVYEVGMSHLGFAILYHVLNGLDWLAAERVYAPWPDMEDLLRANRAPLVSLESERPLGKFDIVGFTLQYELSYSNVLNMLAPGRHPSAPGAAAGRPPPGGGRRTLRLQPRAAGRLYRLRGDRRRRGGGGGAL